MKTVRMWILRFNYTKTFSEEFLNTNFHLSRIICESCEFELFFVFQEMYEHRYLENIKMLYKTAWKCDDQQQYRSVIEAVMVSTPEVFTGNSPIPSSQYVTVKIQVQ